MKKWKRYICIFLACLIMTETVSITYCESKAYGAEIIGGISVIDLLINLGVTALAGVGIYVTADELKGTSFIDDLGICADNPPSSFDEAMTNINDNLKSIADYASLKATGKSIDWTGPKEGLQEWWGQTEAELKTVYADIKGLCKVAKNGGKLPDGWKWNKKGFEKYISSSLIVLTAIYTVTTAARLDPNLFKATSGYTANWNMGGTGTGIEMVTDTSLVDGQPSYIMQYDGNRTIECSFTRVSGSEDIKVVNIRCGTDADITNGMVSVALSDESFVCNVVDQTTWNNSTVTKEVDGNYTAQKYTSKQGNSFYYVTGTNRSTVFKAVNSLKSNYTSISGSSELNKTLELIADGLNIDFGNKSYEDRMSKYQKNYDDILQALKDQNLSLKDLEQLMKQLADKIATKVPEIPTNPTTNPTNPITNPVTRDDIIRYEPQYPDPVIDDPIIDPNDPIDPSDPSNPDNPVTPSDPWGKLKLPQLTLLFPFCIPFDIYAGLQLLKAKEVEPVFTIPIKIDYQGKNLIDYTLVIDMTKYNFPEVFTILRSVQVLMFCIMLGSETKKFIY